jgi:hypothetical protein
MSTTGPRHFHNLSENLPGADRGAIWTFDAVEERLVEAMQVLRRMPDRERGFLSSGGRAIWPQIVHTLEEILSAAPDDGSIRPGPVMRREQADMEEALEWLGYVKEGPARTIVGLALGQLASGSSRVSWNVVWAIMERRGMTAEPGLKLTPDSLRMRYGRALNAICEKLNRAKSGI